MDRLVREWAQDLARATGHHLLVAYTIARTDGEGRPHVHGVLANPPLVSLDCDEMLDAWKVLNPVCGPHSIVEKYDSERGAIRYALDHGGVMVPNVACPREARCRKGRCLGAVFPWRPADAMMNEGRAAARRLRWDSIGRR